MSSIKIDAKGLLDIIPNNSQKTVVFCEIEKTSYEAFFYSLFEEGKWVQSNELASQNQIDNFALDNSIEKIVEEIRKLSEFDSEMRNVVSAVIEDGTALWELKKYEKCIGLYKIKKEWKTKYLH